VFLPEEAAGSGGFRRVNAADNRLPAVPDLLDEEDRAKTDENSSLLCTNRHDPEIC